MVGYVRELDGTACWFRRHSGNCGRQPGYYLVFRHVFFIIEGHAASDSVTTAEISGARASMSPMEVTLQSCRVSATEADDP